jgi:hypothetical protein
MAQGTKPDGTVLLKNTREVSYRLREITKHLNNKVEEGLVVSEGAGGSIVVGTGTNFIGISAGRAIVRGNWHNFGAASISVPSGAVSAHRIDLLFLAPHPSQGSGYSVGLSILQGTAAASPACPEPSSGLGIVLAKMRRTPSVNTVGTTAIKNEARHRFLKILENVG